MVHSTLQNYQTYARRVQLVAYIGLLFRNPLIRPVIHLTTVILVCVLQICLCSALINYLLDNVTSMSSATIALAPICSSVTTTIKVASFALKRKNLKELDDTVKALFDQELKDDSRRPILLSLLPMFKRKFYIYFTLYASALVAFDTPPPISMIYQYLRHIEPKTYRVSVSVKYPWDIPDSGFIYQLHYLLQLCSLLPLYTTNAAAEILFGYYIFHMTGILKTMTHRLQNPEADESGILILRSCAKKHKLLLRCRDILQDIYGPIVINIVLTNCVAMCTLIFQSFQVELTLEFVLLQVIFFFMKFIQINVYAWSGTIMTTASEKFADGVYFSDWIDKSKELRSCMIITMMQKPLIVKASGFFDVSVDLVPKVINTTLSYYFMLKTLNEN